MNPDLRELVNRAALRRSATDPARVGYWLARHRDAEHLTNADLAAQLGTDSRGLALLALCQTPRPDSFAADLECIIQVVPVNLAALANLLRQEQGFAEWAAGTSGSMPTQTGWLLAAHDEDQAPPGEARHDPDPD